MVGNRKDSPPGPRASGSRLEGIWFYIENYRLPSGKTTFNLKGVSVRGFGERRISIGWSVGKGMAMVALDRAKGQAK